MRNIVLILLLAATVFYGCSKSISTNSNVLFYNGTWSLPAISAAWNGVDIITVPIAQGQSSGAAGAPYIQVPAGTNLITLKAGTTQLLDKNIYAGGGSNSSFIFFDTSIIAPAAPARILQLTDDLSLTDTAKFKYRIINLVPDTSIKVDVWLVNGVTDSVRLDSANTFIGTTVLASSVQAFDSVGYHGEQYTLKIRKTASAQVYATSAASYPFTEKGIYSIIFSGLPSGTGNTSLKLSVLKHRTQ